MLYTTDYANCGSVMDLSTGKKRFFAHWRGVASERLRAQAGFSVAPRNSLGEKPASTRILASQYSLRPVRNQCFLNCFHSDFQIPGNWHSPRSRVGECFSPSEFRGATEKYSRARDRPVETNPKISGSQHRSMSRQSAKNLFLPVDKSITLPQLA